VRPTDPRVLTQLTDARIPLSVVVVSGFTTSVLVIGQAFALAALVVAAVHDSGLATPLIWLALVVCARILSSTVSDVASARAAARVSESLRQRVTIAVVAGRTGTMAQGEIAALATRGVSAAEPYLTRYLPTLVLASVLPLLTVAVLASQDVLSAVIVLATLPLLPLFGALVGLAARAQAEAQWRAMASLSGHFVDVMKGLPTLVAFRRAKAQSRTIRAITHRYRVATIKTLRVAFASSAVLELVATLSVALVAVVVGVRLAAGHLDLRTALVVLLLAPEAYWPLRRVGAEFHAAAEGLATFEKMSELEAEPPTGFAAAPEHQQSLSCTNLAFTYPGRCTPSLSGLSVVVAPRSIVAVIGPSGCGKSTLLALMAGLIEPSSGALVTAGISPSSRAWQSQVSWLPQRPLFLTGTVADNLRLGAPLASDEVLRDALTRVALAERVRDLGGLDAQIGEDGSNLSAGERARLALARVVVAARPWVLLDEPTAHLDSVTKQVLLDVIVELAGTAGVVVVAHDPGVALIADQVIALPAVRDPNIPNSTSQPAQPPGRRVVPTLDLLEGDGRPSKGGFLISTALGVLASTSGVALTATAGWLIVKASEHPATLTLLVAIVGVRTFGLGRPVFRYAERLRSHDAALRLLAERRVQVYDAVVPLTPGRLGKRRGDVLTSIVDDVDAVVDRELRLRLPIRTCGAVTVIAAVIGWLVLPAAGLIIGATTSVGAVLAYLVARLGSDGAETDAVRDRALLSAAVLETAQLAQELRMWQAESVALATVDELGRRLGESTRRVAGALAAARAVVHVSALAGVVGVAMVGSDAVSYRPRVSHWCCSCLLRWSTSPSVSSRRAAS
jgi:ATP-binding cassette subfamily C protein CydCD